MKSPRYFLSALFLSLIWSQVLPAEPRIKMTGRKDLVLSTESRQTILEVGRQHLSEKNGAFLSEIQDADSPYAFKQPVVARQVKLVAAVEPERVVVNYDDASVLEAVSRSFAEQVRGTIARGTTSFLQLKGGSMIQPGTSFPVSIPQAQGQTFTVTIIRITQNNYTLRLGDATQTVGLNGNTSTGGGTIKLD
jgi:hypothetical protein